MINKIKIGKYYFFKKENLWKKCISIDVIKDEPFGEDIVFSYLLDNKEIKETYKGINCKLPSGIIREFMSFNFELLDCFHVSFRPKLLNFSFKLFDSYLTLDHILSDKKDYHCINHTRSIVAMDRVLHDLSCMNNGI